MDPRILTKKPVSPSYIRRQIQLINAKELLELFAAMVTAALIFSIFWGSRVNNPLVDGGDGRASSIDTTLLAGLFVTALVLIAIAFLLRRLIDHEKGDLNPLASEKQCQLMMEYCAKYAEIEQYRKTVVEQGRELCVFELTAAERFEKYRESQKENLRGMTAKSRLYKK